jgi:hypothetical protein
MKQDLLKKYEKSHPIATGSGTPKTYADYEKKDDYTSPLYQSSSYTDSKRKK